MERLNSKKEIREKLLLIRKMLSEKRRMSASTSLFKRVLPLLKDMTYVASFASFSHEIDSSLLNRKLCEEKKLCLPCVRGKNLFFYHVENLEQLIPSKWKIWEPDPSKSIKILPEQIDLILVPGLAFDKYNQRLGYGMGYYDRYLATMNGKKVGIAFREQKVASLPTEEHDLPVDQILYF